MNKKRFNQIAKNIKDVKIQGARNIAKAGFRAYKLNPTKESEEKLISLRPTEPMLANVIKMADKLSYKDLDKKFKNNQDRINKSVLKLIKNNRNLVVANYRLMSTDKCLIESSSHFVPVDLH